MSASSTGPPQPPCTDRSCGRSKHPADLRRPRGRAALLAHPPTPLDDTPRRSLRQRADSTSAPAAPLPPETADTRKTAIGAWSKAEIEHHPHRPVNREQDHGRRSRARSLSGEGIERDGEHQQLPESDDEEPGGHEETVGAGSEHNEHWLTTPIGAMSQPANVRTLGWRGRAPLPFLPPGRRAASRDSPAAVARPPVGGARSLLSFRRAAGRRPPRRASGASRAPI